MYQNRLSSIAINNVEREFCNKIFGNDVEKIIDTFVERKSSSKYSLKTLVGVSGMQKLLK